MPAGSWVQVQKRVLKKAYRTDSIKERILAGAFSQKQLEVMYEPWQELDISQNILLNGGRDFLHNQGYITSAVGTAVLQYIALSTDNGAPAAGDTTLTGEVSTNGLARAQATTDTHTAGTNATTIAYTWTASGTVNSIQKCALFTAASNGTMANETTFSVTNMNATDMLTLQYSITLG